MKDTYRNYFEIFSLSILMLFLELMLIRWVSTEISVFAYLQNTVLVVCFLGMGLGFLTARQEVSADETLWHLLLVVALIGLPGIKQLMGLISPMLTLFDDLLVWGKVESDSLSLQLGLVLGGLLAALVLMGFILRVFVPIGQRLGYAISTAPNVVVAYSLNILASLFGILFFALLSALALPPLAWLGFASPLLLYFVRRVSCLSMKRVCMLLGILLVSALASQDPGYFEVHWSPYQKLGLTTMSHSERSSYLDIKRFLEDLGNPRRRPKYAGENYLIRVNNTGYQVMLDLRRSVIDGNPHIFPSDFRGISQYDLPALLHSSPQSMLIVGAGSGNDAAGALRHGVKHVTAVEIDPVIIDMGRRLHPEQPYARQEVRIINDDARSFFASTQEKFDVIAFGLLDSHTTTSMTNARLDHYVYTRESLEQVKGLLNEGGIVTLIFEVRKPFIADRISRALTEVFGVRPMIFRVPASTLGWGGVMFVAGDLAHAQSQIEGNADLKAVMANWERIVSVPELGHKTRVTTDDWPYLYLQENRIPVLYYLLALLLVALGAAAWVRSGMKRVEGAWGRSDFHFFFLGAAFMLLEVQNISKASVVFGNTWQVNALIISGILCMALLANLVVYHRPKIALPPVLVALVGVCLLLYFVDLSRFAALPYGARVIIVPLLTTLPMLFSGVVFMRSLQVSSQVHRALGVNLMGSLAGAILQSVTFITGIRFLMLIVAALYAAAALTSPLGESCK